MDVIRQAFEDHVQTVQRSMEKLVPALGHAAELCRTSLAAGGKIILLGNGGSAADAEHLAAEFTGRYEIERKGLAAIALTAGAPSVTSIANDYGFERVFTRQLEALAKKGDVCIGITTSGKSPNVVRAMEKARMMGLHTIAFTGRDGGQVLEYADIALVVPSDTTSRIQEVHILLGHCLVQMVEKPAP